MVHGQYKKTMAENSKKAGRDENVEKANGLGLLSELFFNLCLPTLVLMKGYVWLGLSPKYGVVLAMSCPFTYGLIEWIREGHFNWISFLGLISISVKGSIGLFECSNYWLAINEALLPGILGTAVLYLRLTHRPAFLTKFLLNDQFCKVAEVKAALKQYHNYTQLIRKVLLYEWLLAGLFFGSSLLNFVLAKCLVVHPAGSGEFNHELGVMTAWSFVIIAVPATLGLFFIVWQFFLNVRKLSHLKWHEIIRD